MLLRSLLAVIVAAVVFPSISQAQRHDYRATRQPVVLRWNRGMGNWHGSGHHWRNPAHNSSYYNAWSEHNSGLVTRGHYPQNFEFQHYTPHQGVDPFYAPTPVMPKKLPAAPLGGSYETFDNEDVDEQVPEIDPAEGEPSKKDLDDEFQELGKQSLNQTSNSSNELPADALIYSTQTRPKQSWEIIK